MKVGVFAALSRHSGGIFQYSLMILQALDQLRGELDPVIVHNHAARADLRRWTRSGWEVVVSGPLTPRTIIRRAIVEMFGDSAAVHVRELARRRRVVRARRRTESKADQSDVSYVQSSIGARLRGNGIDLMLYPAPMNLAFETGLPYVMAIHDLQHRIHPEFPEVSANGEWAAREFMYTNGVRAAEAVIVDSEVGREDVLEFYGHLISPDRVHVLPFVPPPYLATSAHIDVGATLTSLEVPTRYLLFPAQFWPHKNHRRVTEALAALHAQGIDVTVVMTGSASGPIRAATLGQVREILDRKGIGDQVRILGYVDDAAMAALYLGASGVILPTFFGPTNIPVIEAWAVGVPVLTSDIRGIREQCGHAAILVDPASTEAIAEGIRRLWIDDVLRARLVAAGRERVKRNDPGGFRDGLARILVDVDQAIRSRATWG